RPRSHSHSERIRRRGGVSCAGFGSAWGRAPGSALEAAWELERCVSPPSPRRRGGPGGGGLALRARRPFPPNPRPRSGEGGTKPGAKSLLPRVLGEELPDRLVHVRFRPPLVTVPGEFDVFHLVPLLLVLVAVLAGPVHRQDAVAVAVNDQHREFP